MLKIVHGPFIKKNKKKKHVQPEEVETCSHWDAMSDLWTSQFF